MPTYAAFLSVFVGNLAHQSGLHASFQSATSFVYAPQPVQQQQVQVSTQIIITASSSCSVGFGGR